MNMPAELHAGGCSREKRTFLIALVVEPTRPGGSASPVARRPSARPCARSRRSSTPAPGRSRFRTSDRRHRGVEEVRERARLEASTGSIASSMRRVSRSSQSVSTSSASPSPQISPAFDSPRLPLGCSHAHALKPISVKPPSKLAGSPSVVGCPCRVPLPAALALIEEPSYQRPVACPSRWTPPDHAGRDEVASRRRSPERALRETLELVAISTLSGCEAAERAVAATIPMLPSAEVERILLLPDHAPDSARHVAGTGRARLVLVGHLDTVFS